MLQYIFDALLNVLMDQQSPVIARAGSPTTVDNISILRVYLPKDLRFQVESAGA